MRYKKDSEEKPNSDQKKGIIMSTLEYVENRVVVALEPVLVKIAFACGVVVGFMDSILDRLMQK